MYKEVVFFSLTSLPRSPDYKAASVCSFVAVGEGVELPCVYSILRVRHCTGCQGHDQELIQSRLKLYINPFTQISVS